MDPYQPPAEPPQSFESDKSGTLPAGKPIRIWLLQLACVLQFVRTVVNLVGELLTGGGLRDTADAIWLGQAVFWTGFLVALVLAVQRVLPRPGVVAPILAGIWWVHGVYLHLQEWAAVSPPRTANAVEFGGIMAEVTMLWLTASLIYHRKTRAYLSGAAVS